MLPERVQNEEPRSTGDRGSSGWPDKKRGLLTVARFGRGIHDDPLLIAGEQAGFLQGVGEFGDATDVVAVILRGGTVGQVLGNQLPLILKIIDARINAIDDDGQAEAAHAERPGLVR